MELDTAKPLRPGVLWHFLGQEGAWPGWRETREGMGLYLQHFCMAELPGGLRDRGRPRARTYYVLWIVVTAMEQVGKPRPRHPTGPHRLWAAQVQNHYE